MLWYPGWLLRCCYAVAKVPGLVARVFATQLLRYPGWLLGCCYVVATGSWSVARVLLCGC